MESLAARGAPYSRHPAEAKDEKMTHRASMIGAIAVAALGSAACGSPDTTEPAPSSKTAAGNACGIHSSFAGDDNCIPAPAADVGLQLHIGPKDYDNPDDLWVMQPGEENVQCYHLTTPNSDAFYYYQSQYRMRPGSHHMIIATSTDTTAPEGWGNCSVTALAGAIGGTQHTVEDFPTDGKVAPEDQGLGRKIDANTPLDIQLHFYNATSKPTLREVWVNFIYKPASEVTQPLGGIIGPSVVNVAPHTSAVVTGTCDESNAIVPAGADGERIVSLFGHAHWHNERFAVFRVKADSSEDVVYDSYEGAEAPTYVYNSVIENPVSDAATRTSGAISGDFVLHAGESLRWECDIKNDLNITLTGQNEAFTGEMCILFGAVVGQGFPCVKLPAGFSFPGAPTTSPPAAMN